MTKQQILGNYYREHNDTETAIYEAMEHYKNQELSAERERAGKMVEALKECSTALLTETNILTAYTNAIKTIIDYEKS